MQDLPAKLNRPLTRAIGLYLWVGTTILCLLMSPLLFASLANESAAYEVRVSRALEPPSKEEWFGTDSLGRSQWQRTLVGAEISLRVVSGALAFALPIALIMGGIAGAFAGRWPDLAISWIVALLHTVPFFLIVVAASALIGPGTTALPWLIGAVIWAPGARLARIETVRLAKCRFVLASKAMGQTPIAAFWRGIAPLATPPVAVSLLYLFPEIIGIDAILSLFGLGPNPPTPSLGGLVFEGIRRWDAAPWLVAGPSLLLALICIVVHFLADKIAHQVKDLNA